jgi:hypothetical protein
MVSLSKGARESRDGGGAGYRESVSFSAEEKGLASPLLGLGVAATDAAPVVVSVSREDSGIETGSVS